MVGYAEIAVVAEEGVRYRLRRAFRRVDHGHRLPRAGRADELRVEIELGREKLSDRVVDVRDSAVAQAVRGGHREDLGTKRRSVDRSAVGNGPRAAGHGVADVA